MNETECSKLIADVGWTDVRSLISLSILAVINVLVIVGNCLVIAAVFWSYKLRSVTNFFIVSLAVADLLVGIAVLPFSATWEVFKVIPRKCPVEGIVPCQSQTPTSRRPQYGPSPKLV